MIRLKVIFTFMVLFPAILAGQLTKKDLQTFEAYVCLKPEATASRGQILLGDIAEVSGFNDKLILALSDMPLGPSPLPGETLTLGRDQIRRSLVAHRIDPIKVALVGEKRVEVKRVGRTITKEDLAPLIEEYINQSWTDRNVRTEIIYSRTPEETSIVSDNFELRVLDPVKTGVSGSMALSVAALEDDRVLARMPVSLKVRVYEPVAVMERNMRHGEIISPEDISLIEQEITSKRSTPVTSIEMAADKRLKRNMKEGQILTFDCLEFLPLIERGDEVFLIVEYKGIRVGCPGKAWGKGRLGDKIMVRNQYGKNMTGEIRDAHTVLITP